MISNIMVLMVIKVPTTNTCSIIHHQKKVPANYLDLSKKRLLNELVIKENELHLNCLLS